MTGWEGETGGWRAGQDNNRRRQTIGAPKHDQLASEWGNPFMDRKETYVRVYLPNIGGIPMEADNDAKYTHLCHFITKTKLT